jgi:hypothetical protein
MGQSSKEYHREYKKEYRKDPENRDRERKNRALNSPESRRSLHLKQRYGLTVEDWDSIFLEQKGSCKICGTHQSELDRPLYVDHDHETGEVRGLLCQKCNFGIANFRDNIELLKNAVIYLGGA